eukprot:s2923_g4.t1
MPSCVFKVSAFVQRDSQSEKKHTGFQFALQPLEHNCIIHIQFLLLSRVMVSLKFHLNKEGAATAGGRLAKGFSTTCYELAALVVLVGLVVLVALRPEGFVASDSVGHPTGIGSIWFASEHLSTVRGGEAADQTPPARG